jgi:hypothetical protein
MSDILFSPVDFKVTAQSSDINIRNQISKVFIMLNIPPTHPSASDIFGVLVLHAYYAFFLTWKQSLSFLLCFLAAYAFTCQLNLYIRGLADELNVSG